MISLLNAMLLVVVKNILKRCRVHIFKYRFAFLLVFVIDLFFKCRFAFLLVIIIDLFSKCVFSFVLVFLINLKL